MPSFLIYGGVTAIFLALAFWSPDEGTLPDVVRSYFLVLIGAILAVLGLAWTIRRLGHPELTFGLSNGLLLVVAGAGTGLGALTRFRPYWQIASLWPFFAQMSDRVRQVTLVVAGAGILWLGLDGMLDGSRASHTCHDRLGKAMTSHDTVAVMQEIPVPSLRPYKGARPYSCDQLLTEH